MPRHHRTRGASSSAQPEAALASEAMLLFADPAHQRHSDRLRTKPFGVFKLINWTILASLGLQVAIEGVISSTPGWSALFAIQEAAYLELTVEFLSSFDFLWKGTGNFVEFRMGGHFYSFSLQEFNVRMGFCDETFVQTPAYSELLVDLPATFDFQGFWASISNDPQAYTPKKSKGSHLVNPALRFLHYLLTYTLSGRGDSHGVVTRSDLLYLYSLSEQVPLNLGSVLAVFFRHQATNKHVSAIHGGPFITYLAKRLGIWSTLPPLTIAQESLPVTLQSLRAIGLARRQGQDFEAVPPMVNDPFDVDPQGHMPPPPVPPQPQQFPFAPPYTDYFDAQFGNLHTRLDQIQHDQQAMRAHFDDRFNILEQRHTSSMEHLQREFADLRSYYQHGDGSDED